VRAERIRIAYQDRHFAPQEIEVGRTLARVIQHEYDHLEGILFVDHISPFRRSLLKRRLREMARGNVEADYPLALPEDGAEGERAPAA
jgi:peptide deformylase